MDKLFFGLTLAWLVSGCQPAPETDQKATTELKGCTKDLKVCPDGQNVGRNAELNCEFDACPPALAKDKCQGDMKQCPDGSFVIRDKAKNCAFKPCPTAADKTPATVFCTQDVRQCPDGSYVGRDPQQNCAFKLCPNGKRPGKEALKRIE